MRKILVLLLAILMVFAMVACKDPEPEKGTLPVEEDVGKDRLLEQGATAKAVDHTGFKIGLTVEEEGVPLTVELGGKDDVYWLSTAGVSAFFRDHDEKTYMYMSALSYWLKVDEGSLKDKVFSEMVDSTLFVAYEYKDALFDAGTETVKGRSCSKFTASGTEKGVAYSFTIWVDREFGITMKIEASAGGEAFSFTVDPKLSGLTAE
ncbi:MAG: hypothetical protein J5768_05435, partial [Spirochaetales bacterium]|nr:hypothetical protein [Spirochaetales bacterium]